MFFLSREWQDPEDGIEAVLLHWQETLLGQEPNWRKAHPQTMLTPQAVGAPVRRQGVLWVTPPFARKSLLMTENGDRAVRFLLHSFCEVVQRGRIWSAAVESQEIRSATVSHADPSAECTHAMLYYSLDNLAHVNGVPMNIEGLSGRSPFPSVLPGQGVTDKDRKARMRMVKRLTQLPTPHVFHGQMWGPVGEHALYSVYFRREGAYNPFSERGLWLLRNGGLWEVSF